ncbi:MarR family winged helix-turn-helix transcriptional regulator [Ancylobacter oerskovii]|uniref:MarR family winged helix-turn-helix transcriptional regulator n=1 Tax=Ancylobacter oerskovii TaxID=459519 RepID=A0ABW4Z3S7_9HYPH|nr:MarR family transcriptional regulator [Ancylobacter oerskovii]MBS7546042.1 MarR family transcriptional regulator [Ancylobacter oerskovii]
MTCQPDVDFLSLLHELAHLMRIKFDQRARTHDMTRAQWVILVKLDRSPGLTQNELAQLIEVEPITVARLVDRLQARGFVERRHDPQDRRVWRLHLLPAAAPILEEIARARREMVALVVGTNVPPEALAGLEATLGLMKANLIGDARTGCAPDTAA